LRVSWRKGFPPVFVHSDYRTQLKSHRDISAAKFSGDFIAASRVVQDLASDEKLDRIADLIRHQRTFVVSPGKEYEKRENALAPVFAAWIARQMDIDVCPTIFLAPRTRRDFSGGWERLVNPSVFYGMIPYDSDFIVADDVCTMGGTIADLISFLELGGGRVICSTALAADSGKDVPLAISDTTAFELHKEFRGQLDAFLREGLGYGIGCLTEREAGLFRGKGPGLERVRAALQRARHLVDARAGREGGGGNA
jgi:hypothetical protein